MFLNFHDEATQNITEINKIQPLQGSVALLRGSLSVSCTAPCWSIS